MPEPGPLGGAFDQSRDVGDHSLALVPFDRPQHRRQRREGIVRHLRRRPRQPPQQRGLARVRQPDQPDVRQQLQPQLDPVRLPLRPLLGKPRRLPRRGRKALVPMPPAPAMRDHGPLPGLDQVDSAPVHRHRLSPGRHRNNPLLPPRPVPVRPFPMTPPLPPKVPAPFQGPQVPLREIADEHDVAAMPAVPPVGPTSRHMRLPTKRDTAVPPSPTLNPDLRLVVQEKSESRRSASVLRRPLGDKGAVGDAGSGAPPPEAQAVTPEPSPNDQLRDGLRGRGTGPSPTSAQISRQPERRIVRPLRAVQKSTLPARVAKIV